MAGFAAPFLFIVTCRHAVSGIGSYSTPPISIVPLWTSSSCCLPLWHESQFSFSFSTWNLCFPVLEGTTSLSPGRSIFSTTAR